MSPAEAHPVRYARRNGRSARRTTAPGTGPTEPISLDSDQSINTTGTSSSRGNMPRSHNLSRVNTQDNPGNNRASMAMQSHNLNPSSSYRVNNQSSNVNGSRSSSNRITEGQNRRGRGRRVPQYRGGGTHSKVNTTRQFGNTAVADTSKSASSRSITPRPRTQVTPASRECVPKSQAPDVTTSTHEDIKNGHYDCLVCTNEISSSSKVWACNTCWSVLHLSCVRRWADSEASTYKQNTSETAILPPLRKWRCPGCNLPKDDQLISYTCWCSKECDPRPVAGIPPHSCGQTCAKPRGNNCPHVCESVCHAGPCLPCSHMGPSLSCFCGKERRIRKCIDTDYENSWSCELKCDKLLHCGEHKCQKICHEGSCGACALLIESRCYCGKDVRKLPCSRLTDVRESQLNNESWFGSFNCGAECHRTFDCGNSEHFCKKTCHKQDNLSAHCPFSPDMVHKCPCGKTPISALLNEPRKDCTAPIPSCPKFCEKNLSCGHLCPQKCHSGNCESCQEMIQISCHCGKSNSDALCHEAKKEVLRCDRVCRTSLNCGRHECRIHCCPAAKKANERQALKRMNRALNAVSRGSDDFEPEHICIKTCGRSLKCGNHTCSALCHKGPCPSCLDAIFNPISCACGRTVLEPPQPCGTLAPECKYDCTIRPTCGHPVVKHQCHLNTESCPNCPFLVQKICVCRKKILKNQPCWFTEVRCGLICGRSLKCGIHSCQKSCHCDGQCEDSTSACAQTCGRKKTSCEHTCPSPCHAPYPCKETEPCQVKTFIFCPCRNQKQQVKCLATKSSTGNSQKILSCNDDCLKIKRNENLANALGIDQATHKDDHIPYSANTLRLFLDDLVFYRKIEQEMRAFADNEGLTRMRFKPMPPHRRAFIHSLAKDFVLSSESQDVEPHRHVFVFKSPRFVSAPTKKLSECVQVNPEKKAKSSVKPLLSSTSLKGWNAILLEAPRFGLTINEIQAGLGTELIKSGLKFEIFFLPSEDFLIQVIPTEHNSQKVEAILDSRKISFANLVTKLGLASKTVLCSIDGNLNILRRADKLPEYGRLNQAANGVNLKKVVSAEVEKSNSFKVLGTLKNRKVEKLTKDEVPADWELEADTLD
ncbi:hypothetical protein Golomagni_04578 [Golovinomyces magnicellulatus]|nr:hypothetical protein Golomagni_04578 [Golovinomyces magnicellulatus]